ncbi:AraC family transcriptional regulator [Pandoraea commovens]|uniref:AraC family transcriptional regulator n=1 Tax=Pandoraea commovens TaxID=2508289 RepID=A0ABY5QL20_9BURK|nr:AraC family transcriptional regulator [Pandoraea commovens]UVA81048.1 AraC family transcriptional regulator [Pandoraea commovens]
MEKGSISIHFVINALAHVERLGGDPTALLRAADIAPSLLAHPQGRVSADRYAHLWRLISLALDDEFFGQDSRRMKFGSFAMLCHSVVACHTLEQALQRACRFMGLLLDDLEMHLVRDGALARLEVHERPDAKAPRIFGHETLLILFYALTCWLIARRVTLGTAYFAFDEPVYSEEYRTMYSARLVFGAPHTAIEFDAACLDLPVVQNEVTVKDFLRAAPGNIILKYKNTKGMVARVRRRLKTMPTDSWPAFEALAGEFHTTPSTLRRRLEDEGQSYQSIKDQLRRDLAIHALCHTSKPMLEIALSLGFADPSAFFRAFRKWTGARPGDYRRQAVEA